MENDIIERIIALEQQQKIITEEVAELKMLSKEIKTLSESIVKMTTKMEYVSSDLKDIKTEINGIKDKPGETWGVISRSAITAIIAAIISLGISLIFK